MKTKTTYHLKTSGRKKVSYLNEHEIDQEAWTEHNNTAARNPVIQ